MSLTNNFENQLQRLLFNNDTIPNFGDATGLVGSTGAGSLYVALHTSMPDLESPVLQSNTEATYPGYARQAVARTTGGWTVSNEQVTNAAQIQFGQHSGGSPASQTVTHFSLGLDTGAGSPDDPIYTGALSASLEVTNGVNPTFSIGQLQISVD